ncbi:MAG TPA: hypothetical protein PL110_13480, partial [Candidatus Eremiobacteraeota bacterium]|nr:hypothetical protein [Candidatus Eremiobacteraeota bacterium]
EGLGLTGKALMGSTILTGASAVGLGVHGVMELKEGIKNNDKLKALGGGSTLLAAGESGAEFLANTIEGLELFGSVGTGISQSLEFTARVLGIAHGTIDIILGSKEIIDGIREKHTDAVVNGSFEIGIGSTMIMSGLGIGGPVTAVALGTLFAGKIAYNYREEIAEAGKKIADKIKGR